MGGIREFVYSLLIVSVSGSVITMFAPENPRVSKYLNFLISLVITSVLLLPLCNAVVKLPQIKTGDIDFAEGQASMSTYTDTVLEQACENIERELKDTLYQRFDVEPADVKVISNGVPEALEIKEIEVIYDIENGLLYSDTVNYIRSIFDKDCEVRVTCEDI